MYFEKFHAHICIRSKSRRPWSETPNLSMMEIASARYILFNKQEEKLTYPLRLDVFKSRVDIWLTDFYAHLREEYPSIEYVAPTRYNTAYILMHDEFDIIKFLLLYSE
jgi:hypothetical protein